MSFRTVVITNRCKLDLKMGYLVIRGEDTKRVFLSEIAVLLIENSAVSITGCLLEELAARKIKVIFCDSNRNPTAELMPLKVYFQCAFWYGFFARRQHQCDQCRSQFLTVTEKQFAKMEFITGERISDIIDSDERLIFL